MLVDHVSIVNACAFDKTALVLELEAPAEREESLLAMSPCLHIAVDEKVWQGEAGREDG